MLSSPSEPLGSILACSFNRLHPSMMIFDIWSMDAANCGRLQKEIKRHRKSREKPMEHTTKHCTTKPHNQLATTAEPIQHRHKAERSPIIYPDRIL
mmetsp:Transcript_7377/g.13271  ORF Transcript_7377/g.13271 Transcript_7377/m.13271 type:complete len:96 (+) Transcript_7377:71-358(+)